MWIVRLALSRPRTIAVMAILIALLGVLSITRTPTDWHVLQPIWADPKACRVSMKALPFAGATFKDVEISEAGRQFALQLLQPLTANQLDTLFEASGISTYPHVTGVARDPKNWTAAFLDKVKQIQDAGPCPAS